MVCEVCGGTEFYNDKKRKTARCATCQRERMRVYREKHPERVKEQHRKWIREHRLGIKDSHVQKILEEQGFKCAICGDQIDHSGHVDHNHETGKIRGMLCRMCNPALGGFKDSLEIVERAVTYLRKYK